MKKTTLALRKAVLVLLSLLAVSATAGDHRKASGSVRRPASSRSSPPPETNIESSTLPEFDEQASCRTSRWSEYVR